MIKPFLQYIVEDNKDASNDALYKLMKSRVVEAIDDKRKELSSSVLKENATTQIKKLGRAGLYPEEDELSILRSINIISSGGEPSMVQRKKLYALLLKSLDMNISPDLFVKTKKHLEDDQVKEGFMTNESIENPSIVDTIEHKSSRIKDNVDNIFNKLNTSDDLTTLDYNRLYDLFYSGDASSDKNWTDAKKIIKSILSDYSDDEVLVDLVQKLSDIINKKVNSENVTAKKDEKTLRDVLGNKIEFAKELDGKIESLDYADLYNIFFKNKADMEAGKEIMIRLIAQYKDDENAAKTLNKLGSMVGIKLMKVEPEEEEPEPEE